MKLVEIYRIARMGQNFDDYPGFQKIPGMPIRLKHSSSINKLEGSSKGSFFRYHWTPKHLI